jgi:enoyl-CoA hydratase/carnithine racemase
MREIFEIVTTTTRYAINDGHDEKISSHYSLFTHFSLLAPVHHTVMTYSMIRVTTKLIPSRSGNLGVMTLNNPKAMHALNLEMSHCVQDVLKEWYADDTLAAVLLKSGKTETKTRVFCAGGDVKSIYKDAIASPDETHGQGTPGLTTAEFFRQEYIVNHALATATKPQISLWDGIVMGGGVGLSIHGKYRVATENTVFAMVREYRTSPGQRKPYECID